jgi:hypothetical protein
MYVQPYENTLGLSTLAPLGDMEDGAFSSLGGGMPGTVTPGDAISISGAPWLNAMTQNPAQTALFGPLAGLMQQLMQMLQSILGYQGGAPYGGGPYGAPYGGCPPSGCSPYGGEQFFSSAGGASVGDPHLSFNGSHWNSMVSQPNLLNSDSIPGGFQISTQVTSPNSQGVTYNQNASITLNNGQTTISMNNAGQASIDSFGQTVPLAAGQTAQLGNGASVTCNQNGSLTVVAENGYGGEITSTLTPRGEGVNVVVNAQNVDLGGTLANGNQTPTGPGSITGPLFGPVSAPIQEPFPILSPPVAPPVISQPIASPPLIPPPVLSQPGPFPISGSPIPSPRLPIMHPE